MTRISNWLKLGIFFVFILTTACGPKEKNPPSQGNHNINIQNTKILASESFLADIAQNVSGKRLHINSLIPGGLDPHAFEPTPADVAKIADSQVIIINGAGLEDWLKKTLDSAGGTHLVIEASAGLTSRKADQNGNSNVLDPHFWLNPENVIRYVENIRDGFIKFDPDGSETYTSNAEIYISQLKDLDHWIQEQVQQIPLDQRLLVTNHESLGYFADRYGFKIVGAIIPSVSTEASPSAQELAHLIDQIKQSRVRAIFLETGANPKIAEQVAQETGVKVVMDLYTHSLSGPDGNAPTYLLMMRYDTQVIVDALK